MDTTSILSNLQDGCIIMLIGMGVVFAFLVVMVWAMELNAVVIKKLNAIFPEEEAKQQNTTKKKKSDNDDDKIAVAIALAFAQSNKSKV